MDKIVVSLNVTNRVDRVLADRGFIPATQVRSLTLDNVSIDLDAKSLCLPSGAIARLGLDLLKEFEVMTAAGVKKTCIFQDSTISLLGREGTFECLELPDDREPAIGRIPLEMLGIEFDLSQQKLKLLPTESRDTYLKIPYVRIL